MWGGVRARTHSPLSCSFDPKTHSYVVKHTNMNDGWSVTTTIPVQKDGFSYKNYTIAYFVFEKEWNCQVYPPDGQVCLNPSLLVHCLAFGSAAAWLG